MSTHFQKLPGWVLLSLLANGLFVLAIALLLLRDNWFLASSQASAPHSLEKSPESRPPLLAKKLRFGIGVGSPPSAKLSAVGSAVGEGSRSNCCPTAPKFIGFGRGFPQLVVSHGFVTSRTGMVKSRHLWGNLQGIAEKVGFVWWHSARNDFCDDWD